jgi:FkbM family methyltransferase
MTSIRKEWQEHISWLNGGRLCRWVHHPLKAFGHHQRYAEIIRIAKKKQIVRKVATLFWGDKMVVTPPEPVSKELYRFGFTQGDQTVALLNYLQPGMTFIDVGSHYGFFTKLASYLVGDTGCVYAFEPMQEGFRVLSENVRNLSNVFIYQKALFSSHKTLSLRDYGPEWSSFGSITVPRHPSLRGMGCQERTVDAISIDELVNEHQLHPDFIKIDAESAEMDILNGMTATFQNIRPILTVEVGDEKDGENSGYSRDLIDFIVSRHYEAFSYNNDKQAFLPHTPREQYTYSNMLFLPRNGSQQIHHGPSG